MIEKHFIKNSINLYRNLLKIKGIGLLKASFINKLLGEAINYNPYYKNSYNHLQRTYNSNDSFYFWINKPFFFTPLYAPHLQHNFLIELRFTQGRSHEDAVENGSISPKGGGRAKRVDFKSEGRSAVARSYKNKENGYVSRTRILWKNFIKTSLREQSREHNAREVSNLDSKGALFLKFFKTQKHIEMRVQPLRGLRYEAPSWVPSGCSRIAVPNGLQAKRRGRRSLGDAERGRVYKNYIKLDDFFKFLNNLNTKRFAANMLRENELNTYGTDFFKSQNYTNAYKAAPTGHASRIEVQEQRYTKMRGKFSIKNERDFNLDINFFKTLNVTLSKFKSVTPPSASAQSPEATGLKENSGLTVTGTLSAETRSGPITHRKELNPELVSKWIKNYYISELFSAHMHEESELHFAHNAGKEKNWSIYFNNSLKYNKNPKFGFKYRINDSRSALTGHCPEGKAHPEGTQPELKRAFINRISYLQNLKKVYLGINSALRSYSGVLIQLFIQNYQRRNERATSHVHAFAQRAKRPLGGVETGLKEFKKDFASEGSPLGLPEGRAMHEEQVLKGFVMHAKRTQIAPVGGATCTSPLMKIVSIKTNSLINNSNFFLFNENLNQFITDKKSKLLEINNYKGRRMKFGYPIRGQRTKSNAKTAKKR